MWKQCKSDSEQIKFKNKFITELEINNDLKILNFLIKKKENSKLWNVQNVIKTKLLKFKTIG